MARLTLATFGRRVQNKRGGRGIREVAKEIGVSPATLSRVERGNLPDLETFASICRWMKVDPAEVLGIDLPDSQGEEKRAAARLTATAHFRADRTMNPDLAKALAQMIVAADDMLRTEPPPQEG